MLQVAPNEALDAQMRVLLALKGERSGIPALLTAPAAPLEPPLLATSGLASLLVANYDLGKLFDQVNAIAAAITPVDLESMVQRTMAEIARAAGGEEPPLNFRQDVLGRSAPPLMLIGRYDPAKKDDVQAQMLFAAGVRDAESLDSALGRIHAAASQGDKELRRQMLGANIYVLPGSPGSLWRAGHRDAGGTQRRPQRVCRHGQLLRHGLRGRRGPGRARHAQRGGQLGEV